jgi:two-component system OmpR family sensor kinase/two-component system sensor histidine kinase BaeS
MRNSLLIKLMIAFLLVVAIGSVVIAWLTARATQNAFNLYTTRNGQAWAQQFAPILAEYYSANMNWRGVETVLQSSLDTQDSGMMGNGNGQGRGMGAGRQGGMWGMGQRMILADEQGTVINDTSGELNGQPLSAAELKNGTPVMVNGNLVGTILVAPNDFAGANTPAGEFLASVNQSIILSAIIAGVIALLLGAGLFFQITAPLRQLNKAASAIAHGDLSQRVAVRSHDELGELGQTFNQMAETLERAEIQRQHLMADIAHELRTPIAVIQANLEGMLDDVLPLDVEQVAALHTETLLLNRLVGDLRLLSLAEAGELKLEKHATEMSALIRQVVDRINFQAEQKGVSLEVELPENLPSVQIDSDRITQVLNNLIGNALRYTPEGGRITVSAVKSSGPSGAIQVSVSDTGPGIDPAALPYVFDRFYRADQSRARTSGGSGLGLAIVKQLVEAHGGKVEASSPVFSNTDRQGIGTRISFNIPYL